MNVGNIRYVFASESEQSQLPTGAGDLGNGAVDILASVADEQLVHVYLVAFI